MGRIPRRLGDGVFAVDTEFLHTPGHALHHVCILDRDTREPFTGDTFGVSYRESELRASVARLAALEPRCAYLTHYGRVDAFATLARDLDVALNAAGLDACLRRAA